MKEIVKVFCELINEKENQNAVLRYENESLRKKEETLKKEISYLKGKSQVSKGDMPDEY